MCGARNEQSVDLEVSSALFRIFSQPSCLPTSAPVRQQGAAHTDAVCHVAAAFPRLETCQLDMQIPGSTSSYKPTCVCDM